MASLIVDIDELETYINDGVKTLTFLSAFGVNLPGNALSILKTIQSALTVGGLHAGMTADEIIAAIQSMASSVGLGITIPTFVETAISVASAFETNLKNLEGNQAIVIGSGNVTIPALISPSGAAVSKHLRIIVSPDGSDVNNMLGL